MRNSEDINPLNVFGLRRIEHLPPHFESLTFDLRTSEKSITDWVFENLHGRFYFGDRFALNDKGQSVIYKCIAFEDASELSYFGLFLDQINQPENSF
jgi:hypothetical protein